MIWEHETQGVVTGFSHISCWGGRGGADEPLGAVPRHVESWLELEHSQKSSCWQQVLLWVRLGMSSWNVGVTNPGCRVLL